jgi:hypothetical protein
MHGFDATGLNMVGVGHVVHAIDRWQALRCRYGH